MKESIGGLMEHENVCWKDCLRLGWGESERDVWWGESERDVWWGESG